MWFTVTVSTNDNKSMANQHHISENKPQRREKVIMPISYRNRFKHTYLIIIQNDTITDILSKFYAKRACFGCANTHNSDYDRSY